MYNSIRAATWSFIQNKSIDVIGQEMINTADKTTVSIVNIVLQFINVAVVPLSLVVLIITILFLIINIALIKRRQDSEGIEEKTKYLLLCLVIFVVVGAYGLIFGDLLHFITG